MLRPERGGALCYSSLCTSALVFALSVQIASVVPVAAGMLDAGFVFQTSEEWACGKAWFYLRSIFIAWTLLETF